MGNSFKEMYVQRPVWKAFRLQTAQSYHSQAAATNVSVLSAPDGLRIAHRPPFRRDTRAEIIDYCPEKG